MPADAAATSRQQFTVLDWIGTLVAGATIASLGVLPLAGFGGIFRDLGSTADLPLLTRMALMPGFTLVLALPAAASLALAFRARSRLSQRRTWIVAAFILGCLGHGICAVAMYLPIFTIAGKIKAD